MDAQINDINQLAYKIRVLLHETIYTNNDTAIYLKTLLEESDLFNVEYDSVNKLFNLKIKKTNMKKKYDYKHDSLFYYSIINSIYTNFLHFIRPQLEQSIIDKLNLRLTVGNLISLNVVNLLYNINAIADNIIVIKL